MPKESKKDLGKKLQHLSFEYFKAAEKNGPKQKDIFREYQDTKIKYLESEE